MDTRLNKSDYIVIAIVYFVSTLFNCINYYQSGNNILEYFVDFPVIIITSFCVILLFMYWLIPKFLIKEKKYVHFAIFGLIILCSFGMIEYIAGFWSGGNDWSKFPKWYNFMLESIFRSSDDVGFTFGILLTKKFYEGQKEITTIQKQQKENELKLLRSQLDPHFLFNNLNTLDALIDSDPNRAKEYINRLSLIYRYLIQTKDAEVMELSKELELAENYIFLIKTRFGNDYDFTIEKNISIEEKFIPTGALQTLLENVVKHNKVKQGIPIKATISVNEKYLEVINTKSKLNGNSDSFGTGLANLKSRYKILSDEQIMVVNKTNEFKVTIPIINLET